LYDKVTAMEQNAAAEHLQVIRTLMERSALYRRTLTPIMGYVGTVGVLASVGGVSLKLETLRPFCAWWLIAAVVALAGAFLIARRQALKDSEPFWSPPTRRVTQAIVPPLAAGLFFSLVLLVLNPGHMRWLFIFPNALFYGCAVHAAGFFMPRGMKLFGWLVIVLAGLALLAVPWVETDPNPRLDHALMGFFFGVLHLAYGGYLYVTENRKTPA
jgi:hypothetical protein